jgi:hypothetical protein
MYMIKKCTKWKVCKVLIDLLINWFIMMGWVYVSQLQPPTGLLFIPLVICEHGEPWWWWLYHLGIIPDSFTRAFWQSDQQRHLGQVGGMDKRSENFAYQYLKYLKGSLMCHKYYDMGPLALLPIRRKVCCGFLSPLKIHRLDWVWTCDPWVQWQAH